MLLTEYFEKLKSWSLGLRIANVRNKTTGDHYNIVIAPLHLDKDSVVFTTMADCSEIRDIIEFYPNHWEVIDSWMVSDMVDGFQELTRVYKAFTESEV